MLEELKNLLVANEAHIKYLKNENKKLKKAIQILEEISTEMGKNK